MKRSKRLAWLGAIALGVIILLTIVAAPSTNQTNNGSTYGRAPNGYGAWYAYMRSSGTPIKRWQKPLQDLIEQKNKENTTLLRVYSQLKPDYLSTDAREWVEAGNNLVILGVRQPVSKGEFSTMQKSSVGNVKVETGRRRKIQGGEKMSLGDQFGAVVWEQSGGKGKVFLSTTPDLAANAYQDNINNFKYLSDLVRQKGNSVFVDEYIHGYKDTDVKKNEGKGNLLSYLAKTPLLPAFIQTFIVFLITIWAQNRRFGKQIKLETPVVDNSKAYIQALAGVLQKASTTEFVVETIAKEEQLRLQQALGLSSILLERDALVRAWTEKTGREAAELNEVLIVGEKHRRMSEKELISWLGKWQILRETKK